MNVRLVLNFLGRILIYFSLIMLLPLAIAYYYGEPVKPFIAAQAAAIATGVVFMLLKPESELLRYKEGMAIVGLGWLSVSIVGSIPLLFHTHPVNAFFETMSGFTTTGATIFDRVEDLPKSILFWRSLTQWLGGMGIIVLFVAVFPAMARKGEKLFQAEYPGVNLGKLKPRVEDTAIILYSIYLFYTVLEAMILYFLGLSPFDAITHAFTTLSTGGFSTHTESIAYFSSPAIEAVISLFMFLGGTNFALHYFLLTGKRLPFRDPEFRIYAAIIAISAAMLAVVNLQKFDLLESIRYSVFQTVSIVTTTGYTTSDFDTWSDAAKMVILILMFVGGCSGSTAGGMKVIRLYLLLEYAILQVLKAAEPRIVRIVRYGEQVINKEALDAIAAFFILYILVFVFSSLTLALSGLDIITSISSVAACLGNIGPAMGLAGAAESYAALPYHVKLVLAVDMWVGRLEMFTVISLFIPQFWMRKW
ncbi:TrkH family potassium uptake protein [Archaeoglobus veneficus]|uniref:Potassium uptake protein, TrkH family n=1 Tax=Archaeoglobus veneficus (strain DSM 11195 / SNP6) TaxID=693661 RepID=F2KRK7_ARCVS|nr:TrkH family potassium uptake protein [Archaeoglobus veneficus]AEA46772.1 potassium uptake protein, TrkH family [Archaeoglobus veneficus SNP6]